MLKKSCGWWPIWYLLFFCHGGAEGQLQWVVKEKVTDYGQNLTLFCPVKDCCTDGAGWSSGSKTIILDVKAFSNNPNVTYHGTYNTDGFGVVIRNLSEADLNVTYRCVYNFIWSTPKYLLHGDVFKESTEVPDKDKENDTAAMYDNITEIPSVRTTRILSHNKINTIPEGTFNPLIFWSKIIGSIFGASAGIYIVGGIIIGIIAYCMRRKKKRPKSKDDMAEAERNIGMRSDAQQSLNAEMPIQNSRPAVEMEFKIALMGETGVGKSATANTICGVNYSTFGFDALPITTICKQKTVTRFDKVITVIDTPCICNAEANRCAPHKAQDLHAILFVMKIGRVTPENITTVHTFLEYFGHEIQNRVIVVFTHGDKLLENNTTLSEYLEGVPNDLNTFLDDCGNRTIIFNNNVKKEDSHEQVEEILLMIENMNGANEWDLLMKAAKNLQEREVVIVEKLVMKYKNKIEEHKNTIQIKVQRKVMQGRLDEIEKLRKVYEKLLNNLQKRLEMKSNPKKVLGQFSR